MFRLVEVLEALDDCSAEEVVYAARPWTADSAAVVGVEERPPPGLGYLLEVGLAREVLEVWSRWRAGARPTGPEKCRAVIHYAEHDAYLRP